MNVEQALRTIKLWNPILPERVREAVPVIVEALEKQIPKKPIDVITSHNEFIHTVCGNCEHIYGIERNYVFCPYCGQAIDWNEVE